LCALTGSCYDGTPLKVKEEEEEKVVLLLLESVK